MDIQGQIYYSEVHIVKVSNTSVIFKQKHTNIPQWLERNISLGFSSSIVKHVNVPR